MNFQFLNLLCKLSEETNKVMVMNVNDVIDLENGYKIQRMENDKFFDVKSNLKEKVFKDDHSLFPGEYLTDLEKEQVANLRTGLYKDQFTIFLGLFDKEENFVGWSFGYQVDQMTYYMCNSAILNKHRRKGLYTSLMNTNLEILKNIGFQTIYSRHNATNNSVIIPKLKAGFIISSLEMDDVIGVMVTLKYFTNEKRRKIMDYRAGQLKPDDELKSLFKL